MLVVVVSVTAGDVGGKALRYVTLCAVSGHDIGDVITHHPTEPAALRAHVRPVRPHIHGCSYADPYRRGVAPGSDRGLPHCPYHPACDIDVGKLQDEAVGDLPREGEGLGPVRRHPDFELGPSTPRELHGGAVIFDGTGVGQLSNDMY